LRLDAGQRDNGWVTLRAALVIVLRFYALTFAVEALSIVPVFASINLERRFDGTTDWFPVLEIAIFLILALFLWVLAGRVAAALTRGFDGNIVFQINFEEACALGFVVLGIYFALVGIAPLLISLVQLLQWAGIHSSNDELQVRLIRDAERYAIEFAAGLTSVLGARKWARLIAGRERVEG
jgi:hypothetical protein